MREDAGVAGPLVAYPRELALASAGTGKTFLLSTRFVGLLAAGEPPESVFAATFTRKAAGEILERVLRRLAEAATDPDVASELSDLVRLSVRGAPSIDQDRARSLLASVIRSLPLLNVGTLDSFFVRTARGFGYELGLPPGWTLADEGAERAIRDAVVQRVVGQADPRETRGLVTLLAGGEIGRSVHGAMLDLVGELQGLLREGERHPGSGDPWSALAGDPAPDRLDTAALAECEEELRGIELPRTARGTPHAGWRRAMDVVCEAVARRDWPTLLSQTLVEAAHESDGAYSGHPVPARLASALLRLSRHGAAEIRREVAQRARAMGTLAALHEDADRRMRARRGVYRFEDVAHALARSHGEATLHHLFFRLDARVRHLLLDEFQDTSRVQWDALQPVAGEILAQEDGSRAVLVVADPKQSIYGWRGAEPALVHGIGQRYRLDRGRPLGRSWRSSQVVLDAVNRVFREIDDHPLLDPVERETARSWLEDFVPHEAARDQAGHVRLMVAAEVTGTDGKEDETPGIPPTLRVTAELVGELRSAWRASLAGRAGSPERTGLPTIGVLVRRNATVARLIFALRRRGIPASEEGGNPLVDSAPVVALLALLRMADHPSDTAARYLVARSPVGEVVGYRDHRDAPGAVRVGGSVRRALLEDGYAATIHGWVRGLRARLTPRELRRLEQLVELGSRHDDAPTLRPTEFVRRVEEERVEDPTSAPVRVMTIHQAKGLEFDAVILPELGGSLRAGRRPPVLPLRDGAQGPIRAIVPRIPRELRPYLPEAEKAERSRKSRRLRDDLSALYVAMTRPRHALHLVVPPDVLAGGGTLSWARLLTDALRSGGESEPRKALPEESGPSAILLEGGDREWVCEWGDRGGRGEAGTRRDPTRGEERASPGGSGAAGRLLAAPRGPRGRNLPRRTPSELEGGGRVALRQHLRLDDDVLERGRAVHAWCEAIEWVEDGLPSREALLRRASAVSPRLQQPGALLDRFLGWLEEPAVRRALSREAAGHSGWPTRAGAGVDADEDPDDRRREATPSVTVERELRFAMRRDGREGGGEIMEGVLDRVVVARRGGRPVSARVLDFKSDSLERPSAGDRPRARLEARVAHYRPQLEAYRSAAARALDLPEERVRASLVFLVAGVVRDV